MRTKAAWCIGSSKVHHDHGCRMISVMLDTRKVILGGPIGDSEALVWRMNDNLSSIHGVDLFPSVSRCRIKRYGSALGAVSLVVDDAFALVRDDFFSRF